MIEQDARQTIVDGEHLWMLSLGYVISGVMSRCFH